MSRQQDNNYMRWKSEKELTSHKNNVDFYNYNFRDEINKQKIFNDYELKYNSLPNENVAF